MGEENSVQYKNVLMLDYKNIKKYRKYGRSDIDFMVLDYRLDEKKIF